MKIIENKVIRCPCPKKSNLTEVKNVFLCSASECLHSSPHRAFQKVVGVPVLISSATCDTVCDPENIASYVKRSQGWVSFLKERVFGGNKITSNNCDRFIAQIKSKSTSPRVLVVGSGSKGDGTEKLWTNSAIMLYGVDVYVSPSVSIVCDAHYLPFADQEFDGVWIQAVLEHVVEPQKVVGELFRVLKEGGVLYAETPFIQQVHEGAYDFTRFTVVGHRFLFRRFRSIDFGPLNGAEVGLLWSIKYFLIAIFRNITLSKIITRLLEIPLIPFRWLTSDESRFDSCSGSFFLGIKESNYQMSHKQLIGLYRGMCK